MKRILLLAFLISGLSCGPETDEELGEFESEESINAIPPTFTGDFETGRVTWNYATESWTPSSNSQWDYLRGGAPNQVEVGTEMVRQGRLAAKFTLHPGDRSDEDTTNERLEVRSTVGDAGAVEGRESWYGWSLYFPEGFRTRRRIDGAVDARGNAVVTNWKPHGTRISQCVGNPDFGYITPTGVFRVYASPDTPTVGRLPRMALTIAGGVLVTQNASRRECTGIETSSYTVVEPFQDGRWYDLVYHVKWSSDRDVGFIEVWVGGEQVIPKTFAATLYSESTAYMKQGLYRAASPDVSSMYADGMRRGTSFNEVAYRPERRDSIIFEDFGSSAAASRFNTDSKDRLDRSGRGTWAVSRGEFRLRKPANQLVGPANLALHNRRIKGEYDLYLGTHQSGTSSTKPDGFTIVFDWIDAEHYRYVDISEAGRAGINGVFEVEDGVTTEFLSFTRSTAPGTHRVHLIRRSDSVAAIVDGITLGKAQLPLMTTKARVGFGTRKDSAEFDDFIVALSPK